MKATTYDSDGLPKSASASSSTPSSEGATAYRTGDISLTTTPTAITFDLEVKDTGGIHSTSSNTSRMVAPSTGTYILAINGGYYYHGSGGSCEIKVYKNGSAVTGYYHGVYSNVQYVPGPCGLWLIDLTANDYVEVFVYVNSGTGTWYSSGSNVGGYIAVTLVRA